MNCLNIEKFSVYIYCWELDVVLMKLCETVTVQASFLWSCVNSSFLTVSCRIHVETLSSLLRDYLLQCLIFLLPCRNSVISSNARIMPGIIEYPTCTFFYFILKCSIVCRILIWETFHGHALSSRSNSFRILIHEMPVDKLLISVTVHGN